MLGQTKMNDWKADSVLCSQSVPVKLSGQEHPNAAVCGINAQMPPFWHGLTPHGSDTLRDEDWTKTGTEQTENMKNLLQKGYHTSPCWTE